MQGYNFMVRSTLERTERILEFRSLLGRSNVTSAIILKRPYTHASPPPVFNNTIHSTRSTEPVKAVQLVNNLKKASGGWWEDQRVSCTLLPPDRIRKMRVIDVAIPCVKSPDAFPSTRKIDPKYKPFVDLLRTSYKSVSVELLIVRKARIKPTTGSL